MRFLNHWQLQDRLKTLAFALAGWGCYLSASAASIADPSTWWGVVLMFAGYACALGAVALALEIGNRARRTAGRISG